MVSYGSLVDICVFLSLNAGADQHAQVVARWRGAAMPRQTPRREGPRRGEAPAQREKADLRPRTPTAEVSHLLDNASWPEPGCAHTPPEENDTAAAVAAMGHQAPEVQAPVVDAGRCAEVRSTPRWGGGPESNTPGLPLLWAGCLLARLSANPAQSKTVVHRGPASPRSRAVVHVGVSEV